MPLYRVRHPRNQCSSTQEGHRGLARYGVEVTFEAAMAELKAFVAERDWAQFHSPENLAKSVSIEAGELLECFQWGSGADPSRVTDELADVLTYCLLLADALGVEPGAVVLDKLAKTREKYPVNKSRGSSKRYDEL